MLINHIECNKLYMTLLVHKHLEKSFQLLHLLDFCLLHYLLCKSDSKAIAKVPKLHTSFFKTKKNELVFYIIFVKGNTSRFGSAIHLSDMENTLTHVLLLLLPLLFIFIYILLWKNAIFYPL